MKTKAKKKLSRVCSFSMIVIFCMAIFVVQAKAEYPDQQIRYVLHVKPGGATDVLARKLAAGMRKEIGQTVVVENRPGGKSALQMAALTKAKPDGYTIGSVTASHIGAFNKTLKRYDIDSIDWVARIVIDPYLIAIRADSPIKSLKELVKFVKQNPGELKVAGFYDGSGGHIAWEIFAKIAGIKRKDIKWIPYKSVKQAVVAVLGGHSDVTVSYVGLTREYVTTGKLRILGIMADKAPELMPDIPTYKEAGFDVDTGWQQFRGIIAPKGMDADKKARLAKIIEKVMEQPDFKEYLSNAQLNYGFMGPDEFNEFVQKQNVITKNWLKALGLLK
jgi:tripartite-type tricarboxylate transporter receptor subunit TctC